MILSITDIAYKAILDDLSPEKILRLVRVVQIYVGMD